MNLFASLLFFASSQLISPSVGSEVDFRESIDAFFQQTGSKAPETKTEKQIEKRKLEVKGAGIAMMVPRNWGSFSDRSGNVASYRLPSPNKKSEPRLDIGLDFGEGADVASFQNSYTSILATRGDTLIEQYILDVMNGKFAFTKFSRDGRTTLRGVLFRDTKQKLIVNLNSPSDEFDGHFQLFKEVLESFTDTKVVEQRPTNQAPVERTISFREALIVPFKKPKMNFIGVAKTIEMTVSLPQKCKVSKLSDSSYTVTTEGLPGAFIIDLDRVESDMELARRLRDFFDNPLNTFAGGVTRFDDFISSNAASDKFSRYYIKRIGVSVATKKEMATVQCFAINLNGVCAQTQYQVGDFKNRTAEFKKAEAFMNYVSVSIKK